MQVRQYLEFAFPRLRNALSQPRRISVGQEGTRAGQSLIETCLALFLICLLFAGFFQVSQILAAHEVLQHAAARGARAKTVGFNRWMVEKCIYTALIPNSGRMLAPDYENVNAPLRDLTARLAPGTLWDRLLGLTPHSVQHDLERARIPQFLGSENYPRSRAILDYERWRDDSIEYAASATSVGTGGAIVVESEIELTVEQKLPLTVPLHRGFYADDSVRLTGESRIEDHFPLYIDDKNL